MRKTIRFFAMLLMMHLSTLVRADDYPKNYSIDIQHYSFRLFLSDTSDMIRGSASITILFKEGNVRHFRLDFANKTEVRKQRGMEVESVKVDGRSLGFTHANDELVINLAKPPSPGECLIFEINYHGIPSDGLTIGPTKYGNRSFFSENWPNKTRYWLPCIDHPYDKATSEFIVVAPAHYKVISNGLLAEESNLDTAMRKTHWVQSVPISSWLFVLGVADFAVQYDGEVYGKSIQTWVYPKDRDSGFFDFATLTKPPVEFFSEYVGPYVYEKIANISATSHGGMETASAIFYNEHLITGRRTETLRNVVTHELAHQWFGNCVTESTWDDAWLSEGFATFFTLLFIEHSRGHDAYVEGLVKAKEMVYKYTEKDPGWSIVASRSAENGLVTCAITYQKGAWFLHMLRESIGDEAFQKGIRSYYHRFMNSNASTADFLREMESASGKQLKSFFDQWLYRPENLQIKGNWKYDARKKQIVVSLEQTGNSGYVFDVPIEFGFYSKVGAVRVISKFRMNTKNATFIIPCASEPGKLVFDPRTVLLAKVSFDETR